VKPVVLMRGSLAEENEFEICSQYFKTFRNRTECSDSLVIARYSALPFYRELEQDLANHNSQLINSYQQHSWIANFDYYHELKEFTPESWFDYDFYHCQHPGPFVVKGKTNSRKFRWNEMMFAATKAEALRIAGELLVDGVIGEQGVIYREYVPLKTYEIGLNGLPFTDEYRFFFYKETMLAHGYYWSIAKDVNLVAPADCILFAQTIAEIVAKFVNFFVLDIAQTESGEWILIEVNDGQMSGLSEVNPNELYQKLSLTVKEN
jgi:hypothetical protein